jgi:hypothetical protein
MSDFLSGLIFLLACGYGLFALGWIFVAWTEYKFAKDIEQARGIGVKDGN